MIILIICCFQLLLNHDGWMVEQQIRLSLYCIVALNNVFGQKILMAVGVCDKLRTEG